MIMLSAGPVAAARVRRIGCRWAITGGVPWWLRSLNQRSEVGQGARVRLCTLFVRDSQPVRRIPLGGSGCVLCGWLLAASRYLEPFRW
jgi:hypothetical protein